MAKTKAQKNAMLAAYKAGLQGSKGVILIKHSGFTPNESVEFKLDLNAMSSNYNVVKNTIFSLALKENSLPVPETLSFGPHSVIFLTEDIAGIAKKAKEQVKILKDKLEIVGGILDGQSLTAKQIDDIAEMPSKEQSIAMIAGILNMSLSGVINVLEDPIRSVASILDQAFKK